VVTQTNLCEQQGWPKQESLEKLANDSVVRKVRNRLLGVIDGTNNNALAVEKIAVASKAEGSGVKARALGILQGTRDEVLDEWPSAVVGFPAVIAIRLARMGISYGLSTSAGVHSITIRL
jgi:hypothetical protein